MDVILCWTCDLCGTLQFTVGQVQEVVFPVALQEAQQVFPAPDWATRACQTATVFCSGHGQCMPQAPVGGVACQCDEQYYAKDVPASCDAHCDGDVFVDATGRHCRPDTTYFVGVLTDGADSARLLASHLNFAVHVINNKTDGWLDGETAQVSLQVLLNDTACNRSLVAPALIFQKNWAAARNAGQMLDGVIGAEVRPLLACLRHAMRCDATWRDPTSHGTVKPAPSFVHNS